MANATWTFFDLGRIPSADFLQRITIS